MRWTNWVVVAMLAAGCGGMEDIGAPESDSTWTVVVTDAQVPTQNAYGEAWDSLGGAPDIMVCITAGTASEWCTSVANDTFSATWNEVSPVYKHAQLNDVIIRIWDVDVASNDLITEYSGSFQADWFDEAKDITLTLDGDSGWVDFVVEPEW